MNRINYFVMDVDGTLTDGKIYMGNGGEVCKAFHVKDGCGIHDILLPNGIIPVIITGRSSAIVKMRCEELEIREIYQGVKEKLDILKKLLEENSCELKNVAYIGDDINDLPCMQAVKEAGGLVACPKDAVNKVIEIAHFVSSKDGGNGAVREFIEWIMQRNKTA
ncbi:MAG: HAD hydrolase family protein [Lachnospiraceae bacterium]|nr:HAD hydrolase family protein [Lachnospiraceae bacterium]